MTWVGRLIKAREGSIRKEHGGKSVSGSNMSWTPSREEERKGREEADKQAHLVKERRRKRLARRLRNMGAGLAGRRTKKEKTGKERIQPEKKNPDFNDFPNFRN